jgi:phage shock protein A
LGGAHQQAGIQAPGEECSEEEKGERRKLAHECASLAERLRRQADLIEETVASQGVDTEPLRQAIQELQSRLESLDGQHDFLIGRLREKERVQVRTHLRVIDQARRSVIVRLNAIHQECLQPNPNAERIALKSSEIVKAVEAWRRQYLKIEESIPIRTSNIN